MDLDEKREKDSLFSTSSSEARESQTDIHEVSLDTEPPYSDEELQKLTTYIKNITFLYDLREHDWNDDVEDVIKDFLLKPKEPLLTIYFDGDKLCGNLGFPYCPVMDMTYILRDAMEVFDVETFHDNVIFGTVDEHIERSILKIIENVYAPSFFKKKTWPESVRNYFFNGIHMFLTKLTDLHSKLSGCTMLYIPQEGVDISVDAASNDKEYVKRMEAVVVYWTKQIRVALQDTDQNSAEELLCIVDEYDFWVYRYDNLSGLKYQLQHEHLKHICDVLIAVQSSDVKQFLGLYDEIEKNLNEAKSNIEYLQVLKGPCKELDQIKNPTQMPMLYRKILHLIRFIWITSPHYNTVEKIVTLCRFLSNQIIKQCIRYIDLQLVLNAKRTRAGIKMFNDCIECLTQYIKAYVLVSKTHNQLGITPWVLDNAPIFNHVDSFIRRCKDMLEICDAMITVGRYDETEDIPKTLLGTAHWADFDSWVAKIENMFNESLRTIMSVHHMIFDVRIAEWYDCMLIFKKQMRVIDTVIENLTNAVFDEVANVEEGIQSLAALYHYCRRETLRPLFDAKTTLVYNMFREEIQDCKHDLTHDLKCPSRLPYFAGRAMVAHMKKNRLVLMRDMFGEAMWMLPCSISKEVFAQYDKMVASINEMILKFHRKWVDTLDGDFGEKLKRSLMRRSAIKQGFLECNIDKSLLEIFREATYWKSLNFDCPTHLESVVKKAKTIEFIYESVLTVVLDYNKIVSSLSDEERVLFKPLINNVEKKISPGLNVLNWVSEVGDEYIAECCHHTSQLQQFLDDYKTCNLQNVAICEKICNSALIRMRQDYVFHIQELVADLEAQIEKTVDEFIVHYKDIIQYILIVYKGFETQMHAIARQWIKYVNYFDILMEEALKICCRNSLKSVYQSLHGDDAIGPNPVLRLECSLKHNKIHFSPSLNEVESVIFNILPKIVKGLQSLPRLNDKFSFETTYKSYWQIIELDEQCIRLQQKLNDGNKMQTTILQFVGYFLFCFSGQ